MNQAALMLQVAPGTLVQGSSSLLSSKKTDTVLAKSSGWENSGACKSST